MQSLLKLLAYVAKSFGISSPSDNARTSASRKQKKSPTNPDALTPDGPSPNDQR
jgi:hypothetical protein